MRIAATLSVLLASAVAGAAPQKLTITSPAFAPNAAIPVQYTCDGAAHAPLLTWSAVPAGTKSVAILVEDPDAEAGVFTHALVTNVDPGLSQLDLGAALPAGARATRNDAGDVGYLAPCPQDGTHHYHFRVFALDARTAKPRASGVVTREAFLRGITGHVLAQGELVGTYQAR